jgi:hypothetical protein
MRALENAVNKDGHPPTIIDENKRNRTMNEPVAFTSAKEALDTGYANGVEDRKNGSTSENDARELREPFKWRRGSGSPFYEEWRRAYSAGFNGLATPAA